MDDINCKDTSNEAYECFWPVLSSCHLEEAFLSRLFAGHILYLLLFAACGPIKIFHIHPSSNCLLASSQRPTEQILFDDKIAILVEMVIVNPVMSYFSAQFAVCRGPNLNSNNA